MPPLVDELPSKLTPAKALRALEHWPDLVLFESARRDSRLGRYSFLTADPLQQWEIKDSVCGTDPFAAVRERMLSFSEEPLVDLPPFQGGVAGFLGYELGQCFERLPRARHDEFQLPDAWFGIFDWVLAWDHQQDRVWLISQGFPEREPGARAHRAEARRQAVRAALDQKQQVAPAWACGIRPLVPAQLAPQHDLPGHPGVTSDFSREQYLRAVERVIEYITAGDIFQANLSQRLLVKQSRNPVELHERLRSCNPAPFSGYLAHADWAIVSASPERFLKLTGDEVETRPIKGTRRRKAAPEADLFTRDELRQSEKDMAENVMIVDLLRNDLSRVCEPGSIQVPELCVVETYETVQHLVSEIRGTLSARPLNGGPPADVWSLLAATFPGGSITGAPKVRAMEIIAELEPTVRGPYCGSLFYSGFDGTTDSSILIRTFVCRHGWVQCSAGGGVVAQSSPVAEYEETLHKAAGMLSALD